MLGSLISAGASLIGGLFGQKNTDKQAALQREFAQNQLQWKAKDAEAAGISKVFAMGAPTHSYAPVSTGDLSSGIAGAGAALGKGIDSQNTAGASTASIPGKAGALATELAAAQLDGVRIDNDIKRAELQSKVNIANQPGVAGVLDTSTTPALPGQTNSGLKLKKELAPSSPHNEHAEYGTSPEVRWFKSKYGHIPEVPQELGESQESQPLSAAQWFMRNKILPSFSTAQRTFPYPAPPGSYWSFNPLFGEYQLKKLRGKQLERFYPHP